MERKDWTDKEFKIEKLMLSPDPANDRLVLELVESLGVKEKMIGSLIGCFLSIQNEIIGNKYGDYLKKYINSQKIIELWNSLFMYDGTLVFDNLAEHIPAKYHAEMNYIYFKRTGKSYQTFLKVDSHEHPHRKDAFKAFLTSAVQNIHYVNIPNLSNEEIDEYLETTTLSNQNLRGYFYGIDVEVLSKFKFNFTGLDLEKCSFNGFPEQIFNYPNLHSLSITNSDLTYIPKDWNSVKNLYRIIFHENNFVFKDFDFAQPLSSLQELHLGSNKIWHPFSLINKKRLPLSICNDFETLHPFEIKSNNTPFKAEYDVILKLAAALGKTKFSKKQKEDFFLKFSNTRNFEALPDLSLSEFVLLLNVNFSKIKNKCLSEIAIKAEDDLKKNPLSESSTILILGSLNSKETKAILNEMKIPFSKNNEEGFTHILVGKNPIPFEDFDNTDAAFLTEQKLKNIFEKEKPKFIQEAVVAGDKNINQNIEELLNSEDPSSQMVALEMLRTGGIPEILFLPLLTLAKTSKSKEITKISKKLLKENAPGTWAAAINDRQQFYRLERKFKESEIGKMLKKIADLGSPNAAILLSISLFKKYGKGLQYAIYNATKNSDIRKFTLVQLIKDDCFEYSSGLRFNMWRWYEHDQPGIKNRIILPSFPNDILKDFPNIKELNFHNCRFQKLPPEFVDFKSVSKIDLSYNFLTDLPDCLSEFQSLEHLDLSMNSFPVLPEVLGELTSLKTLTLKKNRVTMAFRKPIISPALQSKLKNCKIIL